MVFRQMLRVHALQQLDVLGATKGGEGAVPAWRRLGDLFGCKLAQQMIDDATRGGTMANEQDIAIHGLQQIIYKRCDPCLHLGVRLGMP